MTDTVNVYEAKTHLSKLLGRVEHGEEIVIARAGRPIAKLVPVLRRTEPRKPGGWEGRVWMAPDFDELPSDLLAAFEGDDPDDPLNQGQGP
jgi:prevent-host-death family protein